MGPLKRRAGALSEQPLEIRCGLCGGPYTVADSTDYGCPKHINSRAHSAT